MASVMVDVRCPVGPHELLMKLRKENGAVQMNPTLNAICLHCSFCTRSMRKKNPEVLRLVHEFWITGELVQTTVELRDGTSYVLPD